MSGAGTGRTTTVAVLLAAAAGVAVGALGTRALLPRPARPPRAEATRAETVHARGHAVMPFELARTLHVFEITTSGGIQDVVARDPDDAATVGLVRRHLRHEAERFRGGDFSDPGSLHGADMPGLRRLAGAPGRIGVAYEDLPAGGRITFSSRDPELVTALHRWFAAQLSDHGSDATYR